MWRRCGGDKTYICSLTAEQATHMLLSLPPRPICHLPPAPAPRDTPVRFTEVLMTPSPPLPALLEKENGVGRSAVQDMPFSYGHDAFCFLSLVLVLDARHVILVSGRDAETMVGGREVL